MSKYFTLAIDPGNIKSAYVTWNGNKIASQGKISNEDLLDVIQYEYDVRIDRVVVEMVASYGMPVGATVFDTCVWIGRFIQECERIGLKWELVYRNQIKNHICHSSKAKDSNVIQALVDRFGDVNQHGKYAKGTKKNPGFFFGISEDVWQAFALAVYSFDNLNENL